MKERAFIMIVKGKYDINSLIFNLCLIYFTIMYLMDICMYGFLYVQSININEIQMQTHFNFCVI